MADMMLQTVPLSRSCILQYKAKTWHICLMQGVLPFELAITVLNHFCIDSGFQELFVLLFTSTIPWMKQKHSLSN
jgi:hypothetical protein